MQAATNRTYRLTQDVRKLCWFLGGLFLLMGSAMLIWAIVGTDLDTTRSRLGMVFGALVCGVIGGLALASLRSRLKLSGDQLEYHSGLRSHRIARQEIGGYRWGHGGGIGLYGRDGTAKLLTIWSGLDFDDRFSEWMDRIPNLAAKDQQEVLDEVAASPSLGRTPEQRLARHAMVNVWARRFNAMVYGATLWVVLWPRPYELALAVAALLPLGSLFLLWRYPQSVTLDGREEGPRAVMALGLIFPGVALLVRASADTSPVDVGELVIPAVLGAAACLALLKLAFPTLRKTNVLLMGAFLWMHPAALVALSNERFDDGVTQRWARCSTTTAGRPRAQITLRPLWSF